MGWIDGLMAQLEHGFIADDPEATLAARESSELLRHGWGEEKLTREVAKINANLITWAAITEMGSLTRQHRYESEALASELKNAVFNTGKSIFDAQRQAGMATELEGIALDTQLATYGTDYDIQMTKISAQDAMDERQSVAALNKELAAASTTYAVTSGRAELDLNNDLLMSELLANEALTQATLTRTEVYENTELAEFIRLNEAELSRKFATEGAVIDAKSTVRAAKTMFDIRAAAAVITADYRSDTELARGRYEAKRAVASKQARIGASGFSGKSGELVVEDMRQFYDGQLTALEDNINAELNLALNNATTELTNTLATTSERLNLKLLQADQEYELTKYATKAGATMQRFQADRDFETAVDLATGRQDVTEAIATGTYTTTKDIATRIRTTAVDSALTDYSTAVFNRETTKRAGVAIADKDHQTKVNNAVQVHDGKVSQIDLDFVTHRENKKIELAQSEVNYHRAAEYQKDIYETNMNWTNWSSQMEAAMAIVGGTVAAESISAASKQSSMSNIMGAAQIGLSLLAL